MVLYRKYRPQKFSEVIGQENVIKTLENEIKQGKVAHAYLFTGPRGLGKTTVARLVAKAANCENRKDGESEPCNQCFNCRAITHGQFLDLIEMDAASQTGVDNVRENIIASTRIPPSRGKYKIFIIDEAHMLSIAAFNALLKTLEEPPPYIIFILATTEIHKVPETIISRCQKFDFTKVDPNKIIKRLGRIAEEEKIKIAPEILTTITQRSEGCVRDAESLLSQVIILDGKEITVEQAALVMPTTNINLVTDFTELIFKQDKREAISKINQLLEEGIDLEHFSKDLIEFLRKILLLKIGTDEKKLLWYLDDIGKDKIQKLTKAISLDGLVGIIEEFVRAHQSLSSAEIPQLPLELAVIKVCLKS